MAEDFHPAQRAVSGQTQVPTGFGDTGPQALGTQDPPPPAQPLPLQERGVFCGAGQWHRCRHPRSPTSRSLGELIFIKTQSLQWFYLETQNLSHQTI